MNLYRLTILVDMNGLRAISTRYESKECPTCYSYIESFIRPLGAKEDKKVCKQIKKSDIMRVERGPLDLNHKHVCLRVWCLEPQMKEAQDLLIAEVRNTITFIIRDAQLLQVKAQAEVKYQERSYEP